jgi:hypothetical protein
MAVTILSAIVTCLVSLFLGQAALRLAGAREWSWLAPPVGLSVAMLIATPAIDVPGRSATMAVLLGALTVAAAVWCLRSPSHRPPLSGLLAATPVAVLVFVPFAAAGHAGTLGTSMNNDMSAHLLFAEGYLSSAVAAVTPLPTDYPFGPHAMVAAIGKGFEIEVDAAFAGWSLALPILNAWTALALARRASWLSKVVAATVVGMPFLVAAFYGQGAFKEVAQAGLVLAVALLLAGCGPALGKGRWVPLALLLGGIISVYSTTGLPWPLLIVGIWLAVAGAAYLRHHRLREAVEAVRRELPALGIGLGVLCVAVLPQLGRMIEFVKVRGGAGGVRIDDIGNLIGPIPGWEAFGVWPEGDFRFPVSEFAGGVWPVLVLVLAFVGAAWAIQRRQWVLPFAAWGAMLIWAVSAETQSPYVAAKGLVIASPLLLALAVFPLVERRAKRRWVEVAMAVVAVGLGVLVVSSDVRALRISPVGPTDHAEELRPLRSILAGQPTLFLGHDDFVTWELAGVPVQKVVHGGVPSLPTRPQKLWEYGEPVDFDSVEPHILNEYEWFVTTRDPAASSPPSQLRLVRQTESYSVWRRVGTVPLERSVLGEGNLSGRLLDCETPAGRAVLRRGSVAAVRPRPIVALGDTTYAVSPGSAIRVEVPLRPGTWDISLAYTSTFPLEVAAPGLRATLPANLDRPGPRWPVGRLVVRGRGSTGIDFHIDETPLSPQREASALLSELVATRVAPERLVPVPQACGRYVDWYVRAPS